MQVSGNPVLQNTENQTKPKKTQKFIRQGGIIACVFQRMRLWGENTLLIATEELELELNFWSLGTSAQALSP